MARLKAHTHSILGLAAAALLLAGCKTRPSGTPAEQLQQQAAVDAKQVRHDLKDAGREARVALDQARVDTKAAVAGAREGWKAGAPKRDAEGDVNINHADQAELETLPGIGAREARHIIAGRPYSDTHQLASRGILSHAEYDRISSRVTAD